MNTFYCLLFLLSSVFTEKPLIEYLKSVPNIHDSSLTDYYFRCQAVGSNLTWIVDDIDTVSFSITDSVDSFLECTTCELEIYFVDLSSEAMENELDFLDGMLVVTSTSKDDLQVACGNGLNEESLLTVSKQAATNNASISMSSEDISLQYLFRINTIQQEAISVYICRINSSNLIWQTNNETLSKSRHFFLSQNSYDSSSLLLATGKVGNVSCGSNNSILEWTTINIHEIIYTKVINQFSRRTHRVANSSEVHKMRTSKQFLFSVQLEQLYICFFVCVL